MTIEFKIGKPEEFTSKQLQEFLGFLILQGQITNPSLEKINNCKILCFAYLSDLPIGIGAIKQVYKTPFDKAGVTELKSQYNYELGYLYVLDKKELRRKGIGKAICKLLIKQIPEENIFSTTEESETNAMKFILQSLNFKKNGENYLGAKTQKEIGLYLLEGIKRIDLFFDDLLTQTIKGNLSHNDIENGIRYEEFQQVSVWKLKYGYKFNIYSNDHLIDGKKHFHFDNKSENIFAKFDYECNLLEIKGNKTIPSNILKELKYFVKKESTQNILHNLWDEQNPTLTYGK